MSPWTCSKCDQAADYMRNRSPRAVYYCSRHWEWEEVRREAWSAVLGNGAQPTSMHVEDTDAVIAGLRRIFAAHPGVFANPETN